MSGFVIDIPEREIVELRERLRNTRWPDELEDTAWDYGTKLSTLKELAAYWETHYDWRKAETYLNSEFHHFTMNVVEGLDRLHYLHEKSSRPDARPLLLIHGWPGSFFEFHKIIPMLVDPAPDQPAFHVVAPSLPGFGFSSAPKTKGFGLKAMARAFDALMRALGYKRYFAQGGDWGAAISKLLGMEHGSACRAIHLNTNMSPPRLWNPLHILQYLNARLLPDRPLLLSRDEIRSQRMVQNFLREGNGYYVIQATRPQTLGYAMTDSPAGLLAWILEKFEEWSDNGGDVFRSFTRDELLTNVALYWFNRAATSSFRIYYEAAHTGDFDAALYGYCPVPTGISAFPVDINAPEAWARPRFNLRRYRTFSHGGHFGALEQPEALASEIRAFLGGCDL